MFISNIDWIVTDEEIIERIKSLSIKELSQLITLPLDISCIDLNYFILNEFRNNSKALYKLCQLPKIVEVPKEINDIFVSNNNISILTDWLSDTYGYFFNDYVIVL